MASLSASILCSYTWRLGCQRLVSIVVIIIILVIATPKRQSRRKSEGNATLSESRRLAPMSRTGLPIRRWMFIVKLHVLPGTASSQRGWRRRSVSMGSSGTSKAGSTVAHLVPLCCCCVRVTWGHMSKFKAFKLISKVPAGLVLN